MKYAGWIFIALGCLFYSGCSAQGVIGVIMNPTRHEKKVPAEYALGKDKEQKILVFVEQPAWLNINTNLRYHLTTSMNMALERKVKIKSANLVSYSKFLEFRTNEPNFSSLDQVAVGAALGADKVLYIEVEKYSLSKPGGTDYYKGFLGTFAVLIDVSDGVKVWPESEKSKRIRIGFELEERGQQIAVNRLTAASAHCIARYLYNCPVDEFKIPDDHGRTGWKDWIE